MSNYLKKDKKPFTQVSNQVLNDPKLSFKAKGLFAYMESKPDGWNFTLKSIATQQKDGIDLIGTAMKELRELNYVSYSKRADGTGEYALHDHPEQEEPKLENPDVEKPMLGKSNRISNKDISSNKDIYRENLKKIKKLDNYSAFRKNMEEAFKENRLLTFKDKINNCKEEYKDMLKQNIQDEVVINSFVDYIKQNKNMGSRLNKYILAMIEDNLSALSYNREAPNNQQSHNQQSYFNSFKEVC